MRVIKPIEITFYISWSNATAYEAWLSIQPFRSDAYHTKRLFLNLPFSWSPSEKVKTTEQKRDKPIYDSSLYGIMSRFLNHSFLRDTEGFGETLLRKEGVFRSWQTNGEKGFLIHHTSSISEVAFFLFIMVLVQMHGVNKPYKGVERNFLGDLPGSIVW